QTGEHAGGQLIRGEADASIGDGQRAVSVVSVAQRRVGRNTSDRQRQARVRINVGGQSRGDRQAGRGVFGTGRTGNCQRRRFGNRVDRQDEIGSAVKVA